LRDNVQARWLLSDGSYQRVTRGDNEPQVNSQLWMLGAEAIEQRQIKIKPAKKKE
jgi:hypothetical protein